MLKKIVKLGAIAPFLAVVACSSGDIGGPSGAATTQPAQQAQALDGASALRGVFFGIGPAAAMFPEVWSNQRVEEIRKQTLALPPAELADKLDQAAAGLRESGNTKGADYTAQVAAALRTGAVTPAQLDRKTTEADRQAQAEVFIARIQAEDPTFLPRFAAELQSGNPVRVDAVLKVAGKKIASFAGATEPKLDVADQRGTVGWWWGAENVAAAVDYVVDYAVAIAAGAVLAILAFWDLKLDGHDRLAHESLVQTLTTRFACSEQCFATTKQ